MSNDGVHSYQDHYDVQLLIYHKVDITFTADSHPTSLTAVTAILLTPLTSKDSPQSARHNDNNPPQNVGLGPRWFPRPVMPAHLLRMRITYILDSHLWRKYNINGSSDVNWRVLSV